MKKLLSMVLSTALALTMFTGCSSSSDAETAADLEAAFNKESTMYNYTDGNESEVAGTGDSTSADEIKVGVIQYMEHSALDAACTGFVDTLVAAGISEENIDIQNAQGEQANCVTIANKFVNDQVDLILAIATPAAQAAAQATTEIPILATAVTDFESAGLTADNISGTSDMNPVSDQIDLVVEIVPDAQTIGVMYCSSEDNSILQADIAIAAIEALGLEYQVFTAADTNEVQQVVQSAVGKVDAIYIPTDNIFAQTMATVAQIAGPAQLPVICGEGGMVESGGLASFGLNYTNLGAQTGEQALLILLGYVNVATIDVEYSPVEDLEAFVNEDMFAQCGLDIPASLLG